MPLEQRSGGQKQPRRKGPALWPSWEVTPGDWGGGGSGLVVFVISRRGDTQNSDSLICDGLTGQWRRW